jgi:hypothetical protein
MRQSAYCRLLRTRELVSGQQRPRRSGRFVDPARRSSLEQPDKRHAYDLVMLSGQGLPNDVAASPRNHQELISFAGIGGFSYGLAV